MALVFEGVAEMDGDEPGKPKVWEVAETGEVFIWAVVGLSENISRFVFPNAGVM